MRTRRDDLQAEPDELGARGPDPLVTGRRAGLDHRDGPGFRGEPPDDVFAVRFRQLAEDVGQRHEVRFRRGRGRVDEPAPPLGAPDGGLPRPGGQPFPEPDGPGDLLHDGALLERRPDLRGGPDSGAGSPADVDLRTRLEAGSTRSGFGEHSVHGGVGRGHAVTGVGGDVDLGGEDRRRGRVTLPVARTEPVEGLREPVEMVLGQLVVERGGEIVGEYGHGR